MFYGPHIFVRPSIDMSESMPIPITVFTGFLGAGKTSIILKLLSKLPQGYKACLLKNEFGDVEGWQLCRLLCPDNMSSLSLNGQSIVNWRNSRVWPL